MSDYIFFANQAQDTDQGSFSDLTSHITYCQQSKAETLNQAAIVEEHGGSTDIRYDYDVGSPNELPENARFNTTVLKVDRVGSEYPAPYLPGL